MRTIKVDAVSSLKVRPDTTNIILRISRVSDSYDLAIEESSKDSSDIKDMLASLGFKRDSLKTISFDIDTRYESYRDKNNDYKRRFIGYGYTQELSFSFLNDNEVLSKILYMLSKGKVDAEIRLQYTISNVDLYINKAILEASKKANSRASLIASSLNLSLGNIVDISYSDSDNNMSVGNFSLCDSAPRLMCSKVDIEPDDIEINKSIRIIYEII